MRFLRAIVLALSIVLMLAACGGDEDNSDNGVRVEDEDAGSIVQLARGETLVVELDGNPSTGYGWHIRNLDTNVLRQEGENEFVPEREVPGSSGIVTLRFVAVDDGSTTLDLAYFRSFEPDADPLRTFQIFVEVR